MCAIHFRIGCEGPNKSQLFHRHKIRFSHACQVFIMQPKCIYEQVHKILILIAYDQKLSLKPVLTYQDWLEMSISV